MNGLWALTWLEIKIFAREPLGLFGTVAIPVVVVAVVGQLAGGRPLPSSAAQFSRSGLPVLGALLMAIGAVVSLVTVIGIYRESGILKRLRASPLRPVTILTAHVLVKLFFTTVTMVLLVAIGRRLLPPVGARQLLQFAVALLLSTCAVLSIGFLIASVVPSARFGQPLASVVFYVMMAFSGLFFPLALLPPWLRLVARVMPLAPAVSLLQGVWLGDPLSSHLWDAAAIAATFVLFTVISSLVFRWE